MSTNWPNTMYDAKRDPRHYEPKQDALDALRAAVVAQTALLRELSQQVRLGFEARAHVFRGMEAGITKLVTELPEAFAALAERLDKWGERFAYIQIDLGRLQAIEAKLSEIDSRTVNQWTAIELTKKRARRRGKAKR